MQDTVNSSQVGLREKTCINSNAAPSTVNTTIGVSSPRLPFLCLLRAVT